MQQLFGIRTLFHFQNYEPLGMGNLCFGIMNKKKSTKINKKTKKSPNIEWEGNMGEHAYTNLLNNGLGKIYWTIIE